MPIFTDLKKKPLTNVNFFRLYKLLLHTNQPLNAEFAEQNFHRKVRGENRRLH